jgi:DNA repair photolyase
MGTMKNPDEYMNGRGAQSNPSNRFNKFTYSDDDPDGVDEPESLDQRTKFIAIFPKTIVNKVHSPDVKMDYSLNPYQGCEHGCTYCYARPTHEYWGYSAGVDFERVILVKKNAPELLEKEFMKKSWAVKPIILSGNTDCYQPCERTYEITRSLLKICLEYRNPVGILTKNVLMERDLDLLAQLAELNLISVNLSITTLDETIRRKLEPRTATSTRKLKLIEELVNINVPVNIMMSPIIPALTDHEIFPIAKAVSELGAKSMYYQIVRLNGPNGEIFKKWVERNFPDRAEKVLHQIQEFHGGNLSDSRFGKRMQGDGVLALNLKRQYQLAMQKYFPDKVSANLRTDLFRRPSKDGQTILFED